jgi:hypothetical protein
LGKFVLFKNCFQIPVDWEIDRELGKDLVRARLAELDLEYLWQIQASIVCVLFFAWKILRAIAILLPRFPLLKEWGYAGAICDREKKM